MSSYVPPPGSIPTLAVPDLSEVGRIHMIGIGGAGMRNLARLFLARGITVTGSDLKDSHGLGELREAGAQTFVGHDAEQLDDPDAVVVSSAIREDNPELAEAKRRRIPVWARAQALAAAAADRRSIAIAGTHGKTTTTSMIALVLERAGLDPTYVIGGDPNETGSGARSGDGDLFVAEADESDGSFLLMRPLVGVVTNVEVDHLDFYPGGLEEILAAFAVFATRCGHVVVCADDDGAMRSVREAGTEVTTYGTAPGADVRLEILSVGPGGSHGALVRDGERVELTLAVDGAHNLLDAAAAVAVAALVGVAAAAAAEALSAFAGVHRRFELRGSARGADFFDDYGHVPTRARRDARRRTPAGPGTPRRGVPTPSLLADAGVVARARREPRREPTSSSLPTSMEPRRTRSPG